MAKNNTISITLCCICEGEISKPEQYKIIYCKPLNRAFWHAISHELIASNSQRGRKIDTKGFMTIKQAAEAFVTPLGLVKAYSISLHNGSQDLLLFCFINPGCCSDAEALERGPCKQIDNHKTNSALTSRMLCSMVFTIAAICFHDSMFL